MGEITEMKFSNDYELLKKYDGTTIRGMNLEPIEKYGLSRNWYGGALRKVGILKDSPIILLIGENCKTVALAVMEDNVAGLTESEAKAFGVEYIKCEKTRKELIEELKALGAEVKGTEKKEELMKILDSFRTE